MKLKPKKLTIPTDLEKLKKGTDKATKKIKKSTDIATDKAKKITDAYKKFAVKANMFDLAAGVAVGSAFTNIINTLVASFVTPVLGMITNNVEITSLFISLNGKFYATIEEATAAGAPIIQYGNILNAVLNFFIVSIILFVFISYTNKIRTKFETSTESATKETTKTCPHCKSKIDITATRCAFCTSQLEEIVVDGENETKVKNTNTKKNTKTTKPVKQKTATT